MDDMELDTVACGDCLDVLATIPDDRAQLIFLDGPYGLGKADWDKFDSHTEYTDFYRPIFLECNRVLKDGGALYVCGVSPRIHLLTPPLVELFTWKSEIIWVLNNPQGMGVNNWVRATETILFVSKGKALFNKDAVRIPHLEHYSVWGMRYTESTVNRTSADIRAGQPYGLTGKQGHRSHPEGRACENIWLFQVPHGAVSKNGRHGHITEKPEGLLQRIILASSNPGDLVLDPFIGSGTTAVAALRLGRHFYGCDVSPEYVAIANSRIERVRNEMVQMELPL